MRVLLDQICCEVTAENVDEAISAAAAMAQKRGRMIVEVLVDGQAWTPASKSTAGCGRAAEEIRLTSAEPSELVGQTFEQAAEALRQADALQQSAAELLQADRVSQAMEKLHEAFVIWSSVQQAVSMGAEVAGLDLHREVASAGFGEAIERLNTSLKIIRTALTNNDPVGLADTLLYDLPEVVIQWRGLLEALRRRVRKA